MKVKQLLNNIDPYKVLEEGKVEEIAEIKYLVDELLEEVKDGKDIVELDFEARKPPYEATPEDWQAHKDLKQLQSRFNNKLTSLLH